VRDGKLTYLPDIYGWDRSPPTQFAGAYRPPIGE
jgi:hypothetical protein